MFQPKPAQIVGLQDQRQPMRVEQLALRTNDRWLPEEKGPMTDAKIPKTNADFGRNIPVIINGYLGFVKC